MSEVIVTTSAVVTCVLDAEGNVVQLFPEITEEFYQTLEGKNVVLDSQYMLDLLSSRNIKSTLSMDHPVLKDWRQNRLQNLMNQSGFIADVKEYRSKVRQAAKDHSFTRIKEHSGKKDELIAQVVHAIDDLQKIINLSGNRLMELYALHFPELVDTINNQVTLAKIIADQPHRDLLTREMFEKISLPRDKIDFIIERQSHSLGGDMDENELNAIREYAQTMLHTQDRRLAMERWIDEQMELFAPNLTAVAGSNVGARLISALGSLMNLAKTHASKIQIIGAEKALFSALKGRGTSPKHGIIFQIPEIGNAPYYSRGKLSRAFANQIAIAARLDAFGGEFLGGQMRENLRKLERELREAKQ